MTVNERCKAIREHYNLSQRAFAERLSITGPSIAHIESGKNNPSDQTLRLICQEFRVNYAWLKDGTGEMLLPEDEAESVYRVMLGESEFAKKVFLAMAKLPPQAWDVLEAWYKNMKAQEKKDGQS